MKKYRPYLTLSELKILHQSCPSPPLTLYLHRYIQDIESGARESNYTPVPTISQKLGFTPKDVDSKKDAILKRKIVLLNEWKTRGSTYMTEEQLALVQEYRLENNLMSAEEELEYVEELFNTTEVKQKTEPSI